MLKHEIQKKLTPTMWIDSEKPKTLFKPKLKLDFFISVFLYNLNVMLVGIVPESHVNYQDINEHILRNSKTH